MENSKKFSRYTVTAALPYANGPKHIGHLAGAYVPADIYVRYMRWKGKDIVFVCGSDEHGTAIANQAIKEHTSPREIIDKYHELNKKSFGHLGISFDIYHRTSEPIHHQTSQEIFLKLNEKNIFEVQDSEQYYDEEAKAFLADRYIVGTCPKCGSDKAYGDQCEKCGASLSPEELINPHSTLSGAKPVMKATKHWYLPLDKYEDWLKQWILEGHKADWRANVYGQCKSWIDAGLHARAVTRDLDWGIKVPVEGGEGKVLYVWFDAPIGYISATKQWAADHGKDWEPYWKGKDTKLVHFIGKDNIVFHCIVFPVILHAHGDFVLPENVPANEFMNLEGDKMSTSRGWSIEMHEYIQDFPERTDELRYVLTAIAPETGDSEFTWKDYQARVNNELVAIWGNLVNRVMVLMHKYFDGKVEASSAVKLQEPQLLKAVEEIYADLDKHVEDYKFRNAQNVAMELARLGNKYLTENEPWKLYKENPEQTRVVLHNCLHLIAHSASCLQFFMPNASQRIFDMLNIKGQQMTSAKEFAFEAGHQLNAAQLLFTKVEDEQIEAQVQKLIDKKNAIEGTNNTAVETIKVKDDISYEQFSAMDIRVGTIVSAEKVEGAQKLLKLSVDVGFETRTVVSGIAEYYEPEKIVGQQVSILLNLQPRKIRGIMSQGMILMAENTDGSLAFVAPTSLVANGGEIR